MNLAVLGDAGATGVPLVEQALAAGNQVTALARSGQKVTITNPTSTLSKATQPTAQRSPRP